jgi:hypothetical protein
LGECGTVQAILGAAAHAIFGAPPFVYDLQQGHIGELFYGHIHSNGIFHLQHVNAFNCSIARGLCRRRENRDRMILLFGRLICLLGGFGPRNRAAGCKFYLVEELSFGVPGLFCHGSSDGAVLVGKLPYRRTTGEYQQSQSPDGKCL